MKCFHVLMAAGVFSLPSWSHASIEDIEELVESVRQEALLEAAYDEERIERFLGEREKKAELLIAARAELAAANSEADALRAQYEGNERTLTQYEADLRERAGDLNDLFAIVRQTALSADSVMQGSLVSAEMEDRSVFLQTLGTGQTPPSIEEIRRLWTIVLSEISESGKVVRFNATVIKPQGDEADQPVTRAGVFTAISEGSYLRYLPATGKLVELSRQPPTRFQRMAKTLEDAESGMIGMALDPSKGAILSLMVQSPNLGERLQQGGGIGYLILVLGAIGLLLISQCGVRLFLSRRAIDQQAVLEEPSDKNPLGRLQIVAQESCDHIETISLRLDEQLAEESSLLKRGLATVAVLAAVSPLLGLLGTVTGMIDTFQSITLFGTGDPKLMSGGISQALITTQVGLAVAIPLVLLHSLLTGKANRMIEHLAKQSSDLLAGL
jgi:biopolymer transport protein ExbB